MRWMWIDRVIVFEPRKRLVAVKNVSLAEEHLHQHFAAQGALPPCPVMPNSLILEGMAQTAGILVGSVHDFREKVVLAKVVTEKGAAIDTFYVTEADGSAIVDGERQAEIGTALRRVAHKQ